MDPDPPIFLVVQADRINVKFNATRPQKDRGIRTWEKSKAVQKRALRTDSAYLGSSVLSHPMIRSPLDWMTNNLSWGHFYSVLKRRSFVSFMAHKTFVDPCVWQRCVVVLKDFFSLRCLKMFIDRLRSRIFNSWFRYSIFRLQFVYFPLNQASIQGLAVFRN